LNNLQYVIEYTSILHAFFAKQQLNNKYLINYNIVINIQWNDVKMYENEYINYPKSMDNYNSIIFHDVVETSTNNISPNTKFVCKYEILIEQVIDYRREFEIAKRIIGPKGKNMKEIFDKCIKLEKSLSLEDKYRTKMKKEDKDKEVVKLRLRGRGSGYKENNKRENNEVLHLCISSKYEETFEYAKNLVEELLNKIFIEYKTYAEKYNLRNKELIYK